MKKLLIAVVTLLILSGAGIGAAQVSGHPITAFLAGQLSRAPKTVAVPQVKQTLTSELPQAELGKDNRNVATPSPSPTAPPPLSPRPPPRPLRHPPKLAAGHLLLTQLQRRLPSRVLRRLWWRRRRPLLRFPTAARCRV